MHTQCGEMQRFLYKKTAIYRAERIDGCYMPLGWGSAYSDRIGALVKMINSGKQILIVIAP
jgi:hypothetical protein